MKPSLLDTIATNDLLRSHVTRVGFDLSLGRTHIAALVLLNEQMAQKRYISDRKVTDLSMRRAFSFFASGIGGCVSRGLVIHHYQPNKRNSTLKDHYTITKAGKLVIDLLRECGIYGEYAAALPVAEAESA